MAELSITISVQGKKPEKLTFAADTTCGALRRRLEQAHGCADGGLRLIHKGKTPGDAATLRSIGVADGARLLLLRTAAQMQADRDAARRAKLQQTGGTSSSAANLAELRADASASKSKPEPAAASAGSDARVIQGDEPEPGVPHVVVQHGRARLRLNVRSETTVTDLRARTGAALGVRGDAVRLLCRGRELHDGAASVTSAGVRGGDSVLALLSGAQHERARRGADRRTVAADADALAARVAGARKRVTHRLVDGGEALLLRGELRGEVERLLGNLAAADDGGGGEAADDDEPDVNALRATLEELQRSIEELL